MTKNKILYHLDYHLHLQGRMLPCPYASTVSKYQWGLSEFGH